jgi:hypothetical protein
MPINFKIFLWLLCVLPAPASALGTKSVDMQVQADIHASMQMQWRRIEVDDMHYQQMKNKIKLKAGWVFLPYGLYVELQTNDVSRIVSLRVNNLMSTNKVDTIATDSIYISHNGNALVTAKKDLAILDPKDRGLLKKHILLFVIKTNPTQKPGQYLANFKFVSNTLP